MDAGISGERIDNRPGLLDLLTDAAHGQIDIVAVMDESRLARDELTAAIIRDRLKRAGITVVTPSGERDLADPSGSFVATVELQRSGTKSAHRPAARLPASHIRLVDSH